MTAEQLRRSGQPSAAIDLCRDALIRFPGHLSMRVTLGWSLLDLGRLSDAREAFEEVRRHAPDNLAAIRGLAQLHTLQDPDDSEAYESEVEAGIEPEASLPVTPAVDVLARVEELQAVQVAEDVDLQDDAAWHAEVPLDDDPYGGSLAFEEEAVLDAASSEPDVERVDRTTRAAVQRLEALLARVQAIRSPGLTQYS